MPDDIQSGVEGPAAAGQDSLFTKEDFMNDSGVEEAAVAEQEEGEVVEEEQVEVPQDEDTVEKAFAERLKHATKKIREEVKDEIMREFAQQRPQQQTQEIPQLPEAEAERLADLYGLSPEAVRVMYVQQAEINRQKEVLQQIARQNYERDEYSQAKAYANAVRVKNPNAPEWDDQQLKEFREDYYKQYGTALSWRDTYRQMVAEEALNPATYQKITRQAQQETIKKIAAKDKDTVKIQGQTARKPSVDDLSDAEFEKLLEEAKQGKYV
jgi:hypothetical protein